GFTFMAPDGTRGAAGGQFTPNPDYWTFEIPLAVSYLANNWNLTANFFYDINTASQGNCCASGLIGAPLTITSGNMLYADLHALYKIGKWSLGPVADFQVQTTGDTGCNAAATALGICNRNSAAQLGGLVGYDFGPVDLQVWVLDTVASQNFAQGPGTMSVFTRLGFRLWGPEAPKPLVAKN
ncbi:MAG: transporter, partial [Hyphomicrobiales bacterium]|nr:transporter [Hyphomicrobiales bacterium]